MMLIYNQFLFKLFQQVLVSVLSSSFDALNFVVKLLKPIIASITKHNYVQDKFSILKDQWSVAVITCMVLLTSRC